MSTLTPLSDRVLCKPVKEQEKVTGFGFVYATAKELEKQALRKAEVIAVGPDVTKVSAGDIVFLGQYQYIQIVDNGVEMWITRDFEIDLVETK